MGVLEYSSNNSGGNWWLDDADWEALEAAGWNVHWKGEDWGEGTFVDPADAELAHPDQLLAPRAKLGHSWLGALATSAAKEFNNWGEGVDEWQRITGQGAWEKGCECCGPPHYFTFYNDDGTVAY